MRNIPETKNRKQPASAKKLAPASAGDNLRHLAFDNSLQANIISTAWNGRLVIANNAACKLLGYSKKELLTKSRSDIFDIKENGFKKMLKQRTAEGHSIALVTAIRKSGETLPCEITSAVFMDEDGIEKAITTIMDRSQSILTQRKIDTKKEKIVADDIAFAKSAQKGIDTKNKKIVADNIALVQSKQNEIDTKREKIVADDIVLAKSEQKAIDTKKEKIVADNIAIVESRQKGIDIKKEKIVAQDIVLAKSEQKEIDTKKEKIVADNIALAKSEQKEIDIKKDKIVADDIALVKSRQKEIDIKKEKIVADNIDLAKSKQKGIDTKKEKIVADNILLAQAKSDALQKESNEWIRSLSERMETERADIVRELHENVNQLLCTSKMYVEMAKRRRKNTELYLTNSSEYTLTAIKEIKKITKGMTTDIIKYLGLCEAIENVVRDTMEVNPVKISCILESFKEQSVSHKFKLNVYRVIQEQLSNIINHARATEVAVSLSQNKRFIILSISDNGVGFDTQKKQKGIGVANIKIRATSYNGITDLVSHPGQGCVLTISFPVTDALLNKS